MKIILNPRYSHLKEFIDGIPAGRYTCDELMHGGRNTVERVIAPDGTVLVVKRYKRPTRANQVIYSFLRWSKPRRSYEFARRLERLGFHTAEPVASIEVPRYGIFHTGYLVTRLVEGRLLSDVNTCHPAEREEILRDFARFTLDLHLTGIRHGDYNAGNVFFRRAGEGYEFSLVDINRMQFRRRLSKKICVKEFWGLLSRRDMISVAAQYATLRGWNADLFCAGVLMERGFDLRGKAKRVLKAAIRPFTKKRKLVL